MAAKELFKCPVVLSVPGRHTLWRCLQSTVTPILASMLEVIDRYANMDLLSEERLSQGLIKLWLNILADSQILDLTSPQNSRYCKSFFCIIPTVNLINKRNHLPSIIIFTIFIIYLLLYFLVSQTRRCLCNITSCWMVKNSAALPHSAGSSECILKICGKNQSLCQVCLGLTKFLMT